MSDKIYVGNGKQVADYDMVNVNLCLSDIPKEHINEFQGKKYIKLTVAKRRVPDNYGRTHSVSVDIYEPKQQDAPAPAPAPAPADDLPF